MTWLSGLSDTRQRGSFPRCLLLAHGGNKVADRLTKLVDVPSVKVTGSDWWMPQGLPKQKSNGDWDLALTQEARIGKDDSFLTADQRESILTWWLKVRRWANVPNWDIASTCSIRGKKGLLLVEAKAHASELSGRGKPDGTTPNGLLNHKKIGERSRKRAPHSAGPERVGNSLVILIISCPTDSHGLGSSHPWEFR